MKFKNQISCRLNSKIYGNFLFLLLATFSEVFAIRYIKHVWKELLPCLTETIYAEAWKYSSVYVQPIFNSRQI